MNETDAVDAGPATAAAHGLGWRIGWTLAGLAPFVAVSAVQLATKFTDDAALDTVSKAAEMPALALAVGVRILIAPRRPRAMVAALLLAGLAASWVGDLALNGSIVIGLGAFLIAHALYIATFQVGFHGRRPSWWALLTIPWFIALLALMTAASTRGNVLTMVGAVLFVTSDSLLAFRLFTPLFQDDISEFLIMLAYLSAQALLATGVLRAEAARSWARGPGRQLPPARTRPDQRATSVSSQ